MAEPVLLIGSGGREHALAWKLAQSVKVKHVYVAPGNAGTKNQKKISNVDLNLKNHEDVIHWCKNNNISLVVVGPEDPLANGIADDLKKAGVKCFGPSKQAAQIEASKAFAKSFMDRYQIPTARWKSFTSSEDAKQHILNAPYDALVVKASGLALGKGVIVAKNKDEAVNAVDTLKRDISSASEVIVIEELLSGEEVTVHGFSDGTGISVMLPAQDHKRLLEHDAGPNTGGMGAYCPCPLISDGDLEFVKQNVLQRAIDGFQKENIPYVGVLYAGLMLTKDGPKVLEFNCRLGDPETQVILPLLQSDLYDVMMLCVEGKLKSTNVQWANNKSAVAIVLVSGGYPESYPKGKIISGFDNLKEPDYLVFHAGTSISSSEIVTSGGRVLAVVAVEDSIQKSAAKALKGSELIQFDGVFYRKDIAQKALKKKSDEGLTYKSSGVDIESADDLVRKIKNLTKQTMRPEVCGGIGGFGGIFDLSGYTDPYLVSKVGSIGERLMVAQECNKYKVAGYDLVSNTVNEILCSGAEPLFFLDTYTCGKLDVDVASEVISGISKGCQEAGCALIGGETAEMPGMYGAGDFDLTAFGRGVVEKSLFIPQKESISPGDVVIGLLTPNINFSGFKIVKNIIKKMGLTYKTATPFESHKSFEDILLTPSKIHVKSVLPLMKKGLVKGAAYINKGGMVGSVKKLLPQNTNIVLDSLKWDVPKIFNWIAVHAEMDHDEMLQRFNFGIDMVLIVDQKEVDKVLIHLKTAKENAVAVGCIKSCGQSAKVVEVNKPNISLHSQKTKVAVLTSGEGTIARSLINFALNRDNISHFEISLVITDQVCQKFQGIVEFPIKVLQNSDIQNICKEINEYLTNHNIDILCLDGFKKLTDDFVNSWKGRILSGHPSLLPAFECPNVYNEILKFGSRISGCTIHLVEPEGKIGKVMEQAAVNVEIDDTEESLKNKVTNLLCCIFPKAVESLACGNLSDATDSNLPQSSVDRLSDFAGITLSNELELQEEVEKILRKTTRPGFTDIDVFDLKASGYTSPYLVSGTDGVGTKLKIAQACNKHDTIGIDLVAMCVNDILTHGAEPLFFMEAYDCGRVNPKTLLSAVSGIAEGCRLANCALVGADINVLPDIYFDNKECIQNFDNYDVVGYAEGALLKENLLPRLNDIKEGDILIGISSSGVHSNGYSLVRKLMKVKNFRYKDPFPLDKTRTIGEVLLAPTKIYVRSVLPLMRKGLVKAAAHITGGGLTENIPRVLPDQTKVVLDGNLWSIPPVLQWIAKEGNLSEKEMLRTFNCGLGMVLIVDPKEESEIIEALRNAGETASTVGRVLNLREGEERVEVKNLKFKIESTPQTKRKVGVLISGSGTNLQALIDYTQNSSNRSSAEIVLVLSNIPDVEGLKRAERAGIPTKVLSHKTFKSRVEFDMAVHSILKESGVEIVCLAGFMRIVSKEFVHLWQGKMLNVHPAILPAFKGMNAHRLVLEFGAKVTGCSVHFVEAEVDAGAIIEQAAVQVDANDDEKSLQEKVKVLEHQIFPAALELLACGKVSRGSDGKIAWHY